VIYKLSSSLEFIWALIFYFILNFYKNIDKKEENKLIGKFKEKYENYMKETSMLIPKLK